jgi:hypothetical protein
MRFGGLSRTLKRTPGGSGKKLMQFLSEGRYVTNVVDGKVTLYGR